MVSKSTPVICRDVLGDRPTDDPPLFFREGVMGASGWVHCDEVDILKVTDKAILIKFVGSMHTGEQFWIPLSQIADADDYNEGDKACNMSITEWIAGEKGIEAEETP